MTINHQTRKLISRRSLLGTSLAAACTAAITVPARNTSAGVQAQQATPMPAMDPEATFSEFSQFLEGRMAELLIPGLAAGVILGDETLTATFGVTSVDHPLPVDADTYFQIGSITKTYTGATIMRLVETGLLDLEAPVRTYLPDFRVADPQVSEDVQIRHLLTHTAGWHDRFHLETGDGDDALALAVSALADAPQVTPPGKFFSYNNSGLMVAGRVIEAVTGQTYEAAVVEQMINPLGTGQSFFLEELITRGAVAVGHAVSPEGQPVVVEPWALPRSENPAGGLTASLNNQLQYARLWLDQGTVDGVQVLKPETVRQMLEPLGPGGTTPFLIVDQVGVTWMLKNYDGVRSIEHLGGTPGQLSNLVIVPDLGFALVILTNSATGAVLGAEAKQWALDHVLGVRTPDLRPVSLSPEQLNDYVGRYEMPEGSGTISIREQDGELTVSVNQSGPDGLMVEGAPMQVVGDDLAAIEYQGLNVYTDFIREDGDVAWIRFVGRTYPKTQDTP